MKIIATLSLLDGHGCRNVEFSIQSGGHITQADTYVAGTLYLRDHHIEPILRSLEGASGGFYGELAVRHSGVAPE